MKHIITHKDLGGIISLMVYIWAKPNDYIKFRYATNLNIEAQIKESLENTLNPENFYIFSMELRKSFLEFDKPYIHFLDHHNQSEKYKHLFKSARLIIRPEYTSTAMMLYKFFSENKIQFTENQKKMVLLGDDFESGKMSIKTSYDLNVLLWEMYGLNLNNFIKRFFKGFDGFTEKERNTIKNTKDKSYKYAETLPIFIGEIFDDNNNPIPTISSYGDITNFLAMDYLLNKYKRNLIFFINTSNEKITIKQKLSNNMLNLKNFSKKYCNGSGGQFLGNGKITDLFLEITKDFKSL